MCTYSEDSGKNKAEFLATCDLGLLPQREVNDKEREWKKGAENKSK